MTQCIYRGGDYLVLIDPLTAVNILLNVEARTASIERMISVDF